MDALAGAMAEAQNVGSAQLIRDGIEHHVTVRSGRADAELCDTDVVWSLDHAKVVEIAEKLTVLREAGHPCHHYVDDFRSPAATLVLSVAEYV